jgi:hypothetical protein
MQWTVLLAVLAVAACLVVAALSKLLAPAPAARALAGVVPSLIRPESTAAIQVAAVLEVGTGLALTFPTSRAPAGVLALGFGLGFGLIGALAQLRGSDTSCGCFGPAPSAPLGVRNVLAGAAIALVAGLALTVGTAPLMTAAQASIESLCILLLTLFVYRGLLPGPTPLRAKEVNS